MLKDRYKNSLIVKAVSIFLVFTFSIYNVSFATAEKNALAPEIKDIAQTPQHLNVQDIGIAIDTGTIKSTYAGNAGKTIIHIQDAHCNYEAQTNINKILDQLSRECNVKMISVEGAEGIVDTTWFRAFPDAEIRKEVADYFMKKGEITGAEFFSINSDYNGSIFGAETKEYYIKNLKAFTKVYPYQQVMENYFKNLETIANRIKSIMYSPELRILDSKIRGFDAKEVELSDYAAFLNKSMKKNSIDINDVPNFKKLIQTLEYEDKIDFDTVDNERSKYIDHISKKMTKEKMTELVAESIRFKKGHIKAVKFYSFLRDLARKYQINMLQDYPSLYYYYIYTKLYDGIDNEKLFKEINGIEAQLKKKLFRDETEEKLDKYTRMLGMFTSLINIELTNDDYDVFKTYSEEFTMQDVLDFLGMLSNRYNLNYAIDGMPAQISDNIPSMISFYEIAMIRDKVLIDNTLSRMKEEGKDRCVLITGGFHTRGMKKLLEQKGVSYVVVTPKITKDVETPYIKVLTNQRTSLEDVITEAAMPGTAAVSQAKKDSSFLSPYSKINLVQTLLQHGGAGQLENFSAKIGRVAEDSDVVDRTIEFFKGAIDREVRLWLKKTGKKFDEKYKDETWAEYIKDDTNWNLVRGLCVTKFENEYNQVLSSLKKADTPIPAQSASDSILKTTEEMIFSIFDTVRAEDQLEEVLPHKYFTSEDFLTLEDVELEGKTVGVREDINIPMKKDASGKLVPDIEIVDGKPVVSGRVTEAARNLKKLSDEKARVVVFAHQARPGKEQYTESLEGHARILQMEIQRLENEAGGTKQYEVIYVDDLYGDEALKKIDSLQAGQILLLKNVRDEEGNQNENSKDADGNNLFIKKLQPKLDLFVINGFSVAHRGTASITGFTEIPNVAGLLMEKELSGLAKATDKIEKPYVPVFGGLKVADYFGYIEQIIRSGEAQEVLTGGMLANVVLMARGYDIGEVNVEFLKKQFSDGDPSVKMSLQDAIDKVKELDDLKIDKEKNYYPGRLVTPLDIAVLENGQRKEQSIKEPITGQILDIGSETIAFYLQKLAGAKTTYLKGSLGNFEDERFALGTRAIYKGVGELTRKKKLFSFGGGGDTDKALTLFGVKLSHQTLAGGAFMKGLEKALLAGVQMLKLSAWRGLPMKMASKKVRDSVGANAMAANAEPNLREEEYSLYDEMLADRFRIAEEKSISVPVEDYFGVTVYLHQDLGDIIARENAIRLKEGKPLIPENRVHPGTWRGRARQMHVDKEWWDILSHTEKQIVASHELIHLDIYNYELGRKKLLSPRAEKTHKLWKAYLEYCKEEKITPDQEDFTDRIDEWGRELNVSGVTVGDFPERASNTTGIRADFAEYRSGKIVKRFDDALDSDDIDMIEYSLVDAYSLALRSGEKAAISYILERMASIIDSNEQEEMLFKEIFLKFSSEYLVWIRKDLCGNLSPAAERMLERWFDASGVAKKENRAKPKNVAAVIMAGGGGERLFPGSTSNNPKQTTRLLMGTSLVEMTVERLVGTIGAKNIYIQTIPSLKPVIYKILRDYGIPEENIFTEPERGDTSGAVGYAAAKLQQLGRGDDVMFLGTADHYINMSQEIDTVYGRMSAFEYAYMMASTVAKNTHSIGTIGIDPKDIGPSEEYGCIRRGPQTFFSKEGVVVAETFIEKPKGEKAFQIFNDKNAQGEHNWLYNSGMYIARPSVFLDAFDEVAPEYGKRFRAIANAPEGQEDEIEKAAFKDLGAWKKAGSYPHSAEPLGRRSGVSLDYVLSQPLTRGETAKTALFMIPGQFQWLDIGGYKAIYEYYRDIKKNRTDKNDNVLAVSSPKNITLTDSSNNLVICWDDNAKISLSGINDSVVVYNPETKTVLVAPVTVKGDSIKDFLKTVAARDGLKGYVTGNMDEVMPVDKLVTLMQTDEDGNQVNELYSGDGLIQGSENSIVNVQMGLAAILDMKGDEGNVILTVVPQEGLSNSPNIVVEKVSPEEIADLKRARPAAARLDKAERLDNFTAMLIRGDVTRGELTAEFYSQYYYDLPVKEASEEVRILRERLARGEYLNNVRTPAKMGTSGLRGSASIVDEETGMLKTAEELTEEEALKVDLTDQEVFINMRAQMEYLLDHDKTINAPSDIIRKFIEDGALTKGDIFDIAGDNRPSTDRLMVATILAILSTGDLGVDVQNRQPSPSVANYGLNTTGRASIMITGSHNPYDENGIKVVTTQGELLKPEEAVLKTYVDRIRAREYYYNDWQESMFDKRGFLKDVSALGDDAQRMVAEAIRLVEESKEKQKQQEGKWNEADLAYINRYVEAFGKPFTEDDVFVFYQQSAVGRYIIPEILKRMGATVITEEPAAEGEFIPIDTEDLSPAARAKLSDLGKKYKDKKPLAIISTDGDSDRPVFCDANGIFLHGDKLGVVAAIQLGIDFIATPISANSRAIEMLQKEHGVKVVQGKVGSPYMVELALEETKRQRKAWFEVNGGFGLASDIVIPETGNTLKALSTRDAFLPMLAAALKAKKENKSVENMITDTFGDYMSFSQSGLIENLPASGKITSGAEAYKPEVGKGIIKSLSPADEKIVEIAFSGGRVFSTTEKGTPAETEATPALAKHMNNIREELLGYIRQLEDLEKVNINKINYIDGVRIYLSNNEIIHLRPSGNAAQFRVYTEAVDQKRANKIVEEVSRPDTGMQVQMVKAFVKGKSSTDEAAKPEEESRLSVGMFSMVSRIMTPTEEALLRAEKINYLDHYNEKYGLSVTKDQMEKALRELGRRIDNRDRLDVVPFFRTGPAIDGYNWGELIAESSALDIVLGKNATARERAEYIFDSLGLTQIKSLKVDLIISRLTPQEEQNYQNLFQKSGSDKKYDQWLQNIIGKDTVKLDAITSKELRDILIPRLMNDIVAERWFQAGAIDVGGVLLPQEEVLAFWPAQVYGQKHIDLYSARNDITAKQLTSRMPLSLQIHEFDEMIVPLEDGYAYIGVKDDVDVDKFIRACEAEDDNALLKYLKRVKVDKGVPMVVSAYTPHAYDKIRVYEVKAVSAELDRTGTISFVDRLKYLAKLKSTDPEFRYANRTSIAMTKRDLESINPKRLKKDLLTMDLVMSAKAIEEAKDKIKKAAVDGKIKPVDIEAIKQPVVVDDKVSNANARFETVGGVPGAFTAGRFTLEATNQEAQLRAPELLRGRQHTLFVLEGEAELLLEGKKPIKLKAGDEFLYYAAMGDYSLRTPKGVKETIIYTQVKPIVDKSTRFTFERGEEIDGETPVYEKSVVFNEIGKTMTAQDELVILNEIEGPEMIAKDKQVLRVVEGRVTLVDKKDNTVFADIHDGEMYVMDRKDLKPYIIRNMASTASRIIMDYEKGEHEKLFYTAFGEVYKRKEDIKKTLIAKAQGKDVKGYKKDQPMRIKLAMPKSTMRETAQDAKGKDRIGTREWYMGVWAGLGLDVVIETYEDDKFVEQAVKRGADPNEITVLVTTKEIINGRAKTEKDEGFLGIDALRDVEGVEEYLNSVRMLPPLEDIEKSDTDVYEQSFEIQALGVLASTLTPNVIADAKDNPDNEANAVIKVLKQWTPGDVQAGYLYCFLPFNQMKDFRTKIPNIADYESNVFGLLKFLIDTLPLIERIDPRKEFKNRREVMLSV